MASVFIELIVIVDHPDDMRKPVGRMGEQVAYDEPYLIPLKKAAGEDPFAHDRLSMFAELGLNRTVCVSLARLGYETPPPIQTQAIPLVLSGVDLLARARPAPARPPHLV